MAFFISIKPLHKLKTPVVKLIRKGLMSFALITLCLMASACGKMPEKVSAPLGVDSFSYYQTYPDISTDPRPAQ